MLYVLHLVRDSVHCHVVVLYRVDGAQRMHANEELSVFLELMSVCIASDQL